MEVKIKENIENAVKKHRLLSDKLHEETTQMVTDPAVSASLLKVYAPAVAAEKLQKKIDDMVTKQMAADKLYNAEVKAQIERAKKAVYPDEVRNFQRPSDYQQQISNALAFLSMEGRNLTDSTAYAILKPFFNDWEQMHLFERAVLQQTGKANELSVRRAFPQALGAVLDVADKYISIFAEAEMLAEQLFIHEKRPDCRCVLTEMNDVTGGYGGDSYDERCAQDRLIELAELIEALGRGDEVIYHSVNSTPEQLRRTMHGLSSDEPDDSFYNWL